MRQPLSERARGRWRSILPALGVGPEYLTGKHTACPICRAGKDRFMFDDKDGRGTWICHGCEPPAGDGIQLAMRVNGWSFKEAAEKIEVLIGDAPVQMAAPGRSDEEKREALRRLWRSSSPVKSGDPVSLWLRNRAGVQAAPSCLRTARRVVYMDEPKSWHPAMVALVQAADGTPVNLHRTYLTEGGQKADVPAPRRMMEGDVPKGSAVRLFPSGPVLGIAEGIETAFAAASLFAIPVWAAINANGLEQWIPPDECREVIVLADNDLSFAGQAAAYRLAKRLATARRSVRVEVPDWPSGWGKSSFDWNDAFLRDLRAEVAA